MTSRHLLWSAGGVLFALVAFPTLFAIVFASAYEVSYQAAVSTTTCSEFFLSGRGSPDNCQSEFTLVLGNTGTREQARIDIAVHGMARPFRYGRSVQTIVATAQRLPAPVLEESLEDEPLRLTVGSLQPNQLVTFSFYTRGLVAYERLQRASTEISAEGVVIEARPRLTLVARLLRNALGLI